MFSVFAYPDINTRGVGRIRDSYANPGRSRGFASVVRLAVPFPLPQGKQIGREGKVTYRQSRPGIVAVCRMLPNYT